VSAGHRHNNNNNTEREKEMKLSDIIDAANTLTAMEEKADALRATVAADTPTLDALSQAVAGWGVLRNRDRLAVVPTPFASWEFVKHSNGAYLDAVVHVIVEREGESTRGELRIRTNVRQDGNNLAAVSHDDKNGNIHYFSAWFSYGDLPNGAREIINRRLIDTWATVTPANVAELWSEAATFMVARAVAAKNYDTALVLARLVVAVES
jgi:hypothetical protein